MASVCGRCNMSAIFDDEDSVDIEECTEGWGQRDKPTCTILLDGQDVDLTAVSYNNARTFTSDLISYYTILFDLFL